MSVTFSFKSDKTRTIKYDCQCLDVGGPFADCFECNGAGFWEYIERVNSVNWAGVNAADMAFVLGFDYQLGVILRDQFARLLARCVRLLNTNDLEPLTIEPSDSGDNRPHLRVIGVSQPARVVFFGRDLDSLRCRVKDFQALILTAKEAGEDIFFG